MAHGKQAAEQLSNVVVSNPSKGDGISAAITSRRMANDTELSPDVRAEATLLANELDGALTTEDATRRMLLAQRAVRHGRANS
jgi:hypothetical protein